MASVIVVRAVQIQSVFQMMKNDAALLLIVLVASLHACSASWSSWWSAQPSSTLPGGTVTRIVGEPDEVAIRGQAAGFTRAAGALFALLSSPYMTRHIIDTVNTIFTTMAASTSSGVHLHLGERSVFSTHRVQPFVVLVADEGGYSVPGNASSHAGHWYTIDVTANLTDMEVELKADLGRSFRPVAFSVGAMRVDARLRLFLPSDYTLPMQVLVSNLRNFDFDMDAGLVDVAGDGSMAALDTLATGDDEDGEASVVVSAPPAPGRAPGPNQEFVDPVANADGSDVLSSGGTRNVFAKVGSLLRKRLPGRAKRDKKPDAAAPTAARTTWKQKIAEGVLLKPLLKNLRAFVSSLIDLVKSFFNGVRRGFLLLVGRVVGAFTTFLRKMKSIARGLGFRSRPPPPALTLEQYLANLETPRSAEGSCRGDPRTGSTSDDA